MLVPMRHAELKHGRLAMLAAIGWPVAELVHPKLVAALHMPNLLEGGCVPTLFNHGLEAQPLTPAMFGLLFVGAIFESRDVKFRTTQGLRINEYALDSVAGDVRFDPLNVATNLPVTDRFELQQAEIINGRLAMLALAAYVAIEAGPMHVPAVCFSLDVLQQ